MIDKMELYTARGISNFPSVQPKLLAPKLIRSSKPHFAFSQNQLRFQGAGLRCQIRSDTSDNTSIDAHKYGSDDPNGRIVVEDTQPDEKKEPNVRIVVEDTQPDEEKEVYDSELNDTPQEGSLLDSLQLSKFFEDFDIKLDFEDTYSLLAFGGGGAVALWLAAAVVGAIDSIPVFPKVLELIGLGYTIWFSSRYLIFKENRDELVTRIEQTKQEVFGSKDN